MATPSGKICDACDARIRAAVTSERSGWSHNSEGTPLTWAANPYQGPHPTLIRLGSNELPRVELEAPVTKLFILYELCKCRCGGWHQCQLRQSSVKFAYIHQFEYTVLIMKDSLRRFKAEIFQALAHPTRIAIVEALRNGEMPAGRLI